MKIYAADYGVASVSSTFLFDSRKFEESYRDLNQKNKLKTLHWKHAFEDGS